MKHLVLFLICLVSPYLYAQTPNLSFEQRTPKGEPQGWSRFGGNYSFTLDSANAQEGKRSLRISDKGESGFCAADWSILAKFGGKRLTLTGYVKTEGTGQKPDTWAGLWMRVDNAAGEMLEFDNSQNRGIKGTTGWKQYTIELPLPDDAHTLHIGGLVVGLGTAWFDNFSLTVDGQPYTTAPARVITLKKAQTDTAFYKGSGIALNTLTPTQTENLTWLGKVWGFVKYHHPAVAAGEHNMDSELFRVMPNLLNASTPAQRDEVLANWLKTFGPVQAADKKLAPEKPVIQPNLAWLSDPQLSHSLRTTLNLIRQAGRPNRSYYITMAPNVGNPMFEHEAGHRQMVTPDAGYRLLALFRYWNMIQYFFPYKNLITQAMSADVRADKDWNATLPEFVPAFVSASDSLSYRLAALKLIGRIHDTHANIYGDRIIDNGFKGAYFSAVQIKNVGQDFVVANYYNDSLGTLSGLRRGDLIKSVDGKTVRDWVDERRAYYPASNEPTRLRNMGILRGHTPSTRVVIDRDGQEMTLAVPRYKMNTIPSYRRELDGSSFPKDSCYALVRPDVGYLFLGNIKSALFPKIFKTFANTKGLVIDLRCYPSEFVVFSLGKYLMNPSPFVKFTNGSVQTPGQFVWSPVLSAGEQNVAGRYKGKVVILVNEETQSQAEYTTMAFRNAPGAVVLGSITAGADGNISAIELPGGIRTWISGIGVNYPDGRETQRIGVGVDVEMHSTRAGLREGRDELLERAIEIIQKK
ncbi:MAG: peptidase S41 [Cytophagales bacterium]|nr:MAG: peptidase S41 [Cytophagales bacterium]